MTPFDVGLAKETCRISKKKSRCPGERPVCSSCARLRQTCKYADDHIGAIIPESSQSNARDLVRSPFIDNCGRTLLMDI